MDWLKVVTDVIGLVIAGLIVPLILYLIPPTRIWLTDPKHPLRGAGIVSLITATIVSLIVFWTVTPSNYVPGDPSSCGYDSDNNFLSCSASCPRHLAPVSGYCMLTNAKDPGNCTHPPGKPERPYWPPHIQTIGVHGDAWECLWSGCATTGQAIAICPGK